MNKNIRSKISFYIFTIIILITGAYSYYQTRSYSHGPILEISEPLNGSLVFSSNLIIKALTKNISFITINDRPIFVNEKGLLNEKLLLSPGYNIIKLRAEDKYQRSIEKKIEIVYQKI